MALQSSSIIFRLFYRQDCVCEAELDKPQLQKFNATLEETQRLSFEVAPKEPGIEYSIQIGDINPPDSIGKGFRRHVEWPEDLYIESARGLVEIKLLSRNDNFPNDPWKIRARLLVVVLSSKLTEEKFEAMVADLTALSSGLLFDLISKSFGGLARKQFSNNVRISHRSAQLELRLLEALVRDLGFTLLDISRQPELTLNLKRVIAPWTGSERLSSDGIAWFAARGVDPRVSLKGRELLGPRMNVVTDSNCIEHGIIRWFLELIKSRTMECARRANAEWKCIEADKEYRSCSFGSSGSLYELFDKPKIERLKEAALRAKVVNKSIQGMLELPFLRNQKPIIPQEPTAVFRYVLHYNRFWRTMREYLRRSTLLLEHNLDERNKPTWRMYEQWVFLQLAAAFEEIGLMPSGQENLFQRLGAHVFTVDLRRGTRLGFRSTDGRIIMLRYEPWIFSRGLARRNGDTVFHGREGEAPWSPDILIEVFEPTPMRKHAQLSFVIVIDAKYTTQIREHHWQDTNKYHMIRSTETGAQIVRQVWVACPFETGDGEIIKFRDPTVGWSSAGPEHPVNALEFLQGAVSLVPDSNMERGKVCPAATELIMGLLNWLQFPEVSPKQKAI